MDPSRVERFVSTDDFEESRAEFECGVGDSGDGLEFFAVAERAEGLSPFDDILRRERVETADAAQDVEGRAIEFDADFVDASNFDFRDRVFNRLGVHFAVAEPVVAKQRGRNFEVFFERIEQSATDRECGARGRRPEWEISGGGGTSRVGVDAEVAHFDVRDVAVGKPLFDQVREESVERTAIAIRGRAEREDRKIVLFNEVGDLIGGGGRL